MSRRVPTETEGELVAEVSLELAVQVPKKYQVILYNDDYTPMQFVVEVIQRFFHVAEDVATRLMMQVHVEGHAVCGVFTHDVAETIVVLVNEYARLNEYPLLCAMEAF
ncbi:MAG: ATP-dependent Clp protease adapter ClpS [Legionellaceae bacterium]|nr:ATP-dependent Clp protease adapter ClpS [Legionellaceae bacterium]